MYNLIFSGYCPKDSIFVKSYLEEPESRHSPMVDFKMNSIKECFQLIERLDREGWDIYRFTILDSDQKVIVQVLEEDSRGKSILECIKEVKRESKRPAFLNTYIRQLNKILN
ncbi:hypothetical protein [Spirosoma lituiforme]